MVMHWLFQHNTGKTCVPMSEYEIMSKWFRQKQGECKALQEELDAVRNERDEARQALRTEQKVSQALNGNLELVQQENGKLWEQLRQAQEDAAVWRSKYEDMQTEVKAAESAGQTRLEKRSASRKAKPVKDAMPGTYEVEL